ncbi:MAG: type II toxin-antitoxin system RelE/ParE family toxin [Candidatus Sungbacteria bacterium]|nr:type II toxin-antitoxin system RelE/ParE family toxin [Candidatus Sungbacteria bacterium]
MNEKDRQAAAIGGIVCSERFRRILGRYKQKDRSLFQEIEKEIEKIINDPTVGKPFRYTLKNRRRVRVGSFVLVYEFHDGELRFIDFDHHDKVYQKKL